MIYNEEANNNIMQIFKNILVDCNVSFDNFIWVQNFNSDTGIITGNKEDMNFIELIYESGIVMYINCSNNDAGINCLCKMYKNNIVLYESKFIGSMLKSDLHKDIFFMLDNLLNMSMIFSCNMNIIESPLNIPDVITNGLMNKYALNNILKTNNY